MAEQCRLLWTKLHRHPAWRSSPAPAPCGSAHLNLQMEPEWLWWASGPARPSGSAQTRPLLLARSRPAPAERPGLPHPQSGGPPHPTAPPHPGTRPEPVKELRPGPSRCPRRRWPGLGPESPPGPLRAGEPRRNHCCPAHAPSPGRPGPERAEPDLAATGRFQASRRGWRRGPLPWRGPARPEPAAPRKAAAPELFPRRAPWWARPVGGRPFPNRAYLELTPHSAPLHRKKLCQEKPCLE